MDEIANVERAIQPAKTAWEAERDDPDGGLNAVLGRIERSIAEIARLQERVQQMLVDHMRRQKEEADAAQASVNASRAQRLYKAG